LIDLLTVYSIQQRVCRP